MMCPTESPLVWWQAWLVLPAEKFAEIRWVKKAFPYCCPLLKSSWNSENCWEHLFKEATLGAEDKSIYLHVSTTQCLHWTPNTPGRRSLGWRCWNARSPGWGGVFIPPKHGTHQINYTVPLYSPITSQCCEPGENMFWALEESPLFGCWLNLKCILGERKRKRGRGDGISHVLQQIATLILSLGRHSWTWGCESVGCAVFLSWIVSLREAQEKERHGIRVENH